MIFDFVCRTTNLRNVFRNVAVFDAGFVICCNLCMIAFACMTNYNNYNSNKCTASIWCKCGHYLWVQGYILLIVFLIKMKINNCTKIRFKCNITNLNTRFKYFIDWNTIIIIIVLIMYIYKTIIILIENHGRSLAMISLKWLTVSPWLEMIEWINVNINLIE